jgi:hypothetical protein
MRFHVRQFYPQVIYDTGLRLVNEVLWRGYSLGAALLVVIACAYYSGFLSGASCHVTRPTSSLSYNCRAKISNSCS